MNVLILFVFMCNVKRVDTDFISIYDGEIVNQTCSINELMSS